MVAAGTVENCGKKNLWAHGLFWAHGFSLFAFWAYRHKYRLAHYGLTLIDSLNYGRIFLPYFQAPPGRGQSGP